MSAFRRRLAGFGEPGLLLLLAIGGLTTALLSTDLVKDLGVAAAVSPLVSIGRHALRAWRASRQRPHP